MSPDDLARLDAACGVASDPHRALKSLYGAGNAVRARECMIGQGERPQEICTPASIRDAILRVWPEIALDPCHAPGSILGARRTYYVPPSIETYGKGKTRTVYNPADGEDGTALPWVPYTYANPPFRDLPPWLEAWARAPMECMLLVPVRTLRPWFRAAMRKACQDGGIVWLDPIAFEGHKQTFPQSLCILYRGYAARQKALADAFKGIGELV